MALLKLLQEGSIDEVKAYVKDNPESVKEKDAETGRLAIHGAVLDRNTRIRPDKMPFF